MFLDKNTFSTVIESAPLVSIDLIVLDENNQALLGERLNKPAQGNWFVPGGRILKNESLEEAFERLTQEELGEAFSLPEATLLGLYDHFYDDNVFGDGFSTHYVAIAYILRLSKPLNDLPHDIQHGKYQWFDIVSLLKDKKVHKHTKWYFKALQKTQG
ncbi:GDP-mannose mannosyl hydrolase [Pseudoalteromonas sp. MSK9-3]|uniref:GDP-mannose mannosyl hydrolase n=1 Tax=Pseudoalteromonas sp. MSK9-3 TaxID=1897633 RepID=UPI000E6D3A62|nr:GDP-mannose mannosyl hydrolase [Pseudoalteromonas sp. MSK9-3]RJE75700.1 GDP-mannose mannosyl hydrolase [Pseudoalteromonas sp. MSK9-3]